MYTVIKDVFYMREMLFLIKLTHCNLLLDIIIWSNGQMLKE